MNRENALGRFLSVLLSMFIGITAFSAEPTDNIVIDNATETYTIHTSKKDPGIGKVKLRQEIAFAAQRIDEKAVAMSFYNSYVTVDKASAPGAKPLYLSVTDESVFFDDAKVCILSFDVEKGKTVTARFEQTFAPEYFTTINLAEPYFVRNKTVTIVVPKELADRINIIEKSLTPEIEKDVMLNGKGEKVYTYKIRNLERYEREPSSPGMGTVVPRLYVCGYFENVNSLYNFLHGFTVDPDPNPESVESMAQRITAGCTTDAQRIESLTHWVMKYIRYTAVEHGEYGYRPDYASEVLRKRYGDCKGMSSLLKSMLVAVGIDARLAWVGSRNIQQDWDEVPSLATGDHMICSVFTGDSILYLDGTAKYQPIGQYSYSIQGKQTIIENGDSCLLHRVPVQSPGLNSDNLTAEVRIGSDGLSGTFRNKLTGESRSAFCDMMHGTNAARRSDFVERYMTYPRHNAQVSDVKIQGDSIHDEVTLVSVEVIDREACQLLDDAVYVELLPFRTGIVSVYETKNRRFDVKLPSPRELNSDFVLEIPDGFTVDWLPQKYEVDNEWLTAFITYSDEGKKVRCKAYMLVKPGVVLLERVEDWNAVARSFLRANQEQLSLKRVVNK